MIFLLRLLCLTTLLGFTTIASAGVQEPVFRNDREWIVLSGFSLNEPSVPFRFAIRKSSIVALSIETPSLKAEQRTPEALADPRTLPASIHIITTIGGKENATYVIQGLTHGPASSMIEQILAAIH